MDKNTVEIDEDKDPTQEISDYLNSLPIDMNEDMFMEKIRERQERISERDAKAFKLDLIQLLSHYNYNLSSSTTNDNLADYLYLCLMYYNEDNEDNGEII